MSDSVETYDSLLTVWHSVERNLKRAAKCTMYYDSVKEIKRYDMTKL